MSVLIIAVFHLFYYYSTMPEDAQLSDVSPDRGEITVDIIERVQIVLLLITIITFLMWIYRINKNLGILSGETMNYSPARSVWSFIIPIVNLFAPYKVLKEIWDISHKNEGIRHSRVNLWWAAYGAIYILKLLYRLLPEKGIYAYIFPPLYLVYIAVWIALSILTLDIVTKIGKAYSRNIAEG